ncbi:MAG: hypothetical protein K2M11_08555 [Paramuribaculum sp.]|nr:hypothetical protein [Paramuribaculum sp.]
MKHLKEEFDKLTFKEVLMYCITIMVLIAAFTLLFCGMFIPPEGEIHNSVLTAFGMVLLFAGTLLGIDIRYANQLESFKKQIVELMAQVNKKEPDANPTP